MPNPPESPPPESPPPESSPPESPESRDASTESDSAPRRDMPWQLVGDVLALSLLGVLMFNRQLIGANRSIIIMLLVVILWMVIRQILRRVMNRG